MKSGIAEAVCERAEKSLGLPFKIYCDIIPSAETDGACIRHDPTPAAERRFTDGSRLVSWNLAFYVREKDANRAREHAKAIVDMLDGATVTCADGTEAYCEAATLPQFIDVDEKDFTTYSATITASYSECGAEDGFPFE